MDSLFKKMGIENALHKAEGPLDSIKWLGLILDARPDRVPMLRLPEKRRRQYRQVVLELRHDFKDELFMPVRRLAEVLGKLNFASKAVPGGAFFMARMWDRFRGTLGMPFTF